MCTNAHSHTNTHTRIHTHIGDGRRGQRIHGDRDRQAHRVAEGRTGGNEGCARGEGMLKHACTSPPPTPPSPCVFPPSPFAFLYLSGVFGTSCVIPCSLLCCEFVTRCLLFLFFSSLDMRLLDVWFIVGIFTYCRVAELMCSAVYITTHIHYISTIIYLK